MRRNKRQYNVKKFEPIIIQHFVDTGRGVIILLEQAMCRVAPPWSFPVYRR